MNKALSLLGLAQRAGKLVSGDEGVLKAVRSGTAQLVIVAVDASEAAVKKYRDKCSFYNVPLIRYGSRIELGASIGKQQRVVIALLDQGFARSMRNTLQNLSEVKDIEQGKTK